MDWQFVLALIQSGCSGSEANTILTYLNMPHGSTFHKSTFSHVQSAQRDKIMNLSNFSMKSEREREIEATIGENKYTEYLKGNLMPNEIRLTTSYDMGWNKRSSGHKYDSISGHGFLLRTKN